MILEEFLELQGPDEDIHDYIESIRDENENATASQRAREYAIGKFPDVIDSEAREILGGGAEEDKDPTEAVIGKCLSQIASRIRLRSFNVEDEKVLKYLEELVVKNRLPKKMVGTSFQQMTDGSAAMSVSWQNGRNGRPGRAMIHSESWWDGESGVFISVDDSGDASWVVKEWKGRDKVDYRTLYLDDVIYRYAKEGAGWKIVKETPWLRGKDQPIGITFAHFPNGEVGSGPYPPSTVAQVVDAQDALNRTLFFRQAASALTGMQVYYGTGVAADEDQIPKAGTFWSSVNPDAKFGAITAGSIEALHKEVDDLRGIISGQFPVPAYRITQGQWPSGLALQRADNPMLAQAMQLIEVNAAGAVHLAHRSVELHNIFGASDGGTLNEDSWITAEFESPESVDPGTQVEVDQAKVNLYQSLSELPEALIEASGVLEADVIKALIAERKANMEMMADSMVDRVPQEDDEIEA